MYSRKRMIYAINHKEPDRIPLIKPNIINTYEKFNDKVQKFLDTFEFDKYESLGFIKENPAEKKEIGNDKYKDGYGCKYKYKGVGLPYCTYHPLAKAKTINDINKFDWPEIKDNIIENNAKSRAKKIREENKFITRIGFGMIFHRYQWLRGFDQWLIDLKMQPELHDKIADKIFEINMKLGMMLLNEVGEYVDIVSIGDDLGTSVSSFMSMESFQKHIKPYFKKMITKIKSKFPKIKIYLHCHGQVMDFVPHFIDCGVDILNPILPLDNMDPIKLKENYGDQLCFSGGIDIEKILPFKSQKEVEEHVKKVIDILSPGGGYIFKAQAISPKFPPENIISAYEIARKYGQY